MVFTPGSSSPPGISRRFLRGCRGQRELWWDGSGAHSTRLPIPTPNRAALCLRVKFTAAKYDLYITKSMWRGINQGDSQQYQPPAGRAPPTKPTVTLKPVKAPDLPTNIQDVQGTEKQIRRHFGNPISKIQAVRNSREQVTCSLNKMAREKKAGGGGREGREEEKEEGEKKIYGYAETY